MKLIIASLNKGKIREFTKLFQEMDIEVSSLIAYPDLPEVEETGTTFEENARIKAETIAKLTGSLVLADDSGLVVPALDGEPGIYSARYAGEPKDDKANISKLLRNLSQLDATDRSAYFVSCLVVAHPVSENLSKHYCLLLLHYSATKSALIVSVAPSLAACNNLAA